VVARLRIGDRTEIGLGSSLQSMIFGPPRGHRVPLAPAVACEARHRVAQPARIRPDLSATAPLRSVEYGSRKRPAGAVPATRTRHRRMRSRVG
jgi:hypothetical protein